MFYIFKGELITLRFLNNSRRKKNNHELVYYIYKIIIIVVVILENIVYIVRINSTLYAPLLGVDCEISTENFKKK